MANRITAADIEITVDGQKVDPNHITSVEVCSDLNQPDAVEICLSNFDNNSGGSGGGEGGGGLISAVLDKVGSNITSSRFSSQYKPGATLEVKMGLVGEGLETVFKGAVAKNDPQYDTYLPVTVKLHGFNKLHNLARNNKTRTFVDRTDKQIVSQIASENGLSPNFGKKQPNLMHEHLHQGNQTDLEFLRLRASRLGRNLWVDLDNSTLYFIEYEKDQGPVAKLKYTEEMDSSLENFNPQLNSGAQVQTVKVYGWDPKKKQKIIGVYTAEASQLGSELGAGSFNDQPVLNINNVPVRTKEEADLVAKSIGVERNMNYVTGSGTTKGNAKIKVGKIVEIETDDDRFNGKSYVAGVRHTFSHTATGLGGGTGMGGFKTTVKFQRDATKK